MPYRIAAVFWLRRRETSCASPRSDPSIHPHTSAFFTQYWKRNICCFQRNHIPVVYGDILELRYSASFCTQRPAHGRYQVWRVEPGQLRRACQYSWVGIHSLRICLPAVSELLTRYCVKYELLRSRRWSRSCRGYYSMVYAGTHSLGRPKPRYCRLRSAERGFRGDKGMSRLTQM